MCAVGFKVLYYRNRHHAEAAKWWRLQWDKLRGAECNGGQRAIDLITKAKIFVPFWLGHSLIQVVWKELLTVSLVRKRSSESLYTFHGNVALQPLYIILLHGRPHSRSQ